MYDIWLALGLINQWYHILHDLKKIVYTPGYTTYDWLVAASTNDTTVLKI